MGKRINRSAKIQRYFNEQSGHCAYCACEMTLTLNKSNTATIDHIIPKAQGGLSNEFNEVASCSDCNNWKSDKPLKDVIWELQEFGVRHEHK